VGLKWIAWGAPFSAGAGYFVRQDSKPRQSLARGLPTSFDSGLPDQSLSRTPIRDRVMTRKEGRACPRNARRVTGGANIKSPCPHGHKARTAGRMGALFAGAAQKGKNPGIYKLTSHLVHSRVFEFFPE
jgi:hypothetical protein